MHFQILSDKFYTQIIPIITKRFQDFKPTFEVNNNVYFFLGEFSLYLLENIENEKIFYDAINFFEEALENGGSATEDAIVIQLFEKIYENNELSDRIEMSLSENSQQIFKKFR